MKKENVKLGIAPIAWTNDDMPDLGRENTFEQCISEMALAGYQGTEVGNKYPREAAVLKKYLDIRGLVVCNAWFSTFFTTKPMEETCQEFIKHRDFLFALGAKVIGVSEQGNSVQGQLSTPVLENKPVFNEQEWEKLTAGLEKLADLAAEKGMTVGLHHHMGTGIQTMAEIDQLMERCSDKVYLLYDTGHAAFAGIAPLELLQKYKTRINHVHLKDLRADVHERVKTEKMSFLNAVRAGVFTVPGDGVLNFAPIFAELRAMDYCGWMVVEAEQDPAKANPFEYALKARNYVRELTGL